MKRNPPGQAGVAHQSPPPDPGRAEIAPDEMGIAWRAAFCVLAVVLLLLLWFPVARIPAHYTITMNEGINAYYEHVAGTGGKVYGHPPKYEYANSPPVFFHLIGWLGSLTGDINVTGRWVSLLACFAIAVFASLIVHRLGNSRRLGAYAGLCWLPSKRRVRKLPPGLLPPDRVAGISHRRHQCHGPLGVFAGLLRDRGAGQQR